MTTLYHDGWLPAAAAGVEPFGSDFAGVVLLAVATAVVATATAEPTGGSSPGGRGPDWRWWFKVAALLVATAVVATAVVYYGGGAGGNDGGAGETATAVLDSAVPAAESIVTTVVPAVLDSAVPAAESIVTTVVPAVAALVDDSVLTRIALHAAGEVVVAADPATLLSGRPGYSTAVIARFAELVAGHPDNLARQLVAAMDRLGPVRDGRFIAADEVVLRHSQTFTDAVIDRLRGWGVDGTQARRFAHHGMHVVTRELTREAGVVDLAWGNGQPLTRADALPARLANAVFHWLVDTSKVFRYPVAGWSRVDQTLLSQAFAAEVPGSNSWFNCGAEFFRELTRVSPSPSGSVRDNGFRTLVRSLFGPAAADGSFPALRVLFGHDATASHEIVARVVAWVQDGSLTAGRARDLVYWFLPSWAQAWFTGTAALDVLKTAHTAGVPVGGGYLRRQFIEGFLGLIQPLNVEATRPFVDAALGDAATYAGRTWRMAELRGLITPGEYPATGRVLALLNSLWDDKSHWCTLVGDALNFKWPTARVTDLLQTQYAVDVLKASESSKPR